MHVADRRRIVGGVHVAGGQPGDRAGRQRGQRPVQMFVPQADQRRHAGLPGGHPDQHVIRPHRGGQALDRLPDGILDHQVPADPVAQLAGLGTQPGGVAFRRPDPVRLVGPGVHRRGHRADLRRAVVRVRAHREVALAHPVQDADQPAERPGDPAGGAGGGDRGQAGGEHGQHGHPADREPAQREAAPLQGRRPGGQRPVQVGVGGPEPLEQGLAGGHVLGRLIAARRGVALALGQLPPGVGAGHLGVHRPAFPAGAELTQLGHGRRVPAAGHVVRVEQLAVAGDQVTAQAALGVGEHAAQMGVGQLERLDMGAELVDGAMLHQHGGHLGQAGTHDQQHQDSERPGEQPAHRSVAAHRSVRRGPG
jgi:hypothetical protein